MGRGLWLANCAIILLLLKFVSVDSYKILMVAPSHSKSHLIVASALLKGLAERGHEVECAFVNSNDQIFLNTLFNSLRSL